MKHLAASCYGTLATLKKTKNFTNYKLRKHLAESLVLSRLGLSDVVFYQLTENLLKKLQRIQFSAASFVTGHYVNSVNTLFKLGWLPLIQRRDWHLLKAAHKALYFEHWPKNLRLETVQHGRCLRSSETINLKKPLESGTFQDCAAERFNSLPVAMILLRQGKTIQKMHFRAQNLSNVQVGGLSFPCNSVHELLTSTLIIQVYRQNLLH